jgi:hypothetical protein
MLIHTPIIINGKLLSDANASFQLFMNIIITTAQMVIKSGIKVVTLFDNTSFSELTSPIILANTLPVGLLSKKSKLNV